MTTRTLTTLMGICLCGVSMAGVIPATSDLVIGPNDLQFGLTSNGFPAGGTDVEVTGEATVEFIYDEDTQTVSGAEIVSGTVAVGDFSFMGVLGEVTGAGITGTLSDTGFDLDAGTITSSIGVQDLSVEPYSGAHAYFFDVLSGDPAGTEYLTGDVIGDSSLAMVLDLENLITEEPLVITSMITGDALGLGEAVALPEPSSITLAGLSLLALVFRRRAA